MSHKISRKSEQFVNQKTAWRRLLGSVFPLVTVLLFLSACTSAPVQEMSDARQAIQAAKNYAVDEIALQSIRLAEEHLYKATLALNIGDYGDARKSANAARNLALEVQKLSAKFARVF